MLLKYIGGMTTELFLTGPSGKEYVQKPGEDLQVADEDVAYFLGLGAWEVKSAVPDSARSSKPRPSGDTGNG